MHDFLINSAQELSIEINDAMTEQFFMYKDMLLEWNEKINLTTIVEDREIILKHFIDSISVLKAVDISENTSVVDIGSGAGFPGVPIKIVCPSCKVTLVDSLNKRIKFLQEVVLKLNLQHITCVHSRAEDFAKDHRESFDVCTSRAVADLAILSEFCLPLVKIGGYFAALKGKDINTEISTSKKAINVLGGEIVDVKKIEIPNSDIIHSIVVIKKLRQTSLKYPRKAGFINKNPIK